MSSLSASLSLIWPGVACYGFSPIFCIVPFCFLVFFVLQYYFVLAISFLPTLLLYLSPRDHILQSFSLLFSFPETINIFREGLVTRLGLLVSPIPTSPHTAAYITYIFDYPNISHHVLFVIKASSLLQLGVCMYCFGKYSLHQPFPAYAVYTIARYW